MHRKSNYGKYIRRLRRREMQSIPMKLREAQDFAELSKLAKWCGVPPSYLLNAGWRTSDK